MFVLRTISNGGSESNIAIGNEYTVIYRETNNIVFSQSYCSYFDIDVVLELEPASNKPEAQCFAFVVYQDGSKIWPLYCNDHYYMMTETGSTFNNLTLKG